MERTNLEAQHHLARFLIHPNEALAQIERLIQLEG